MIEAIEQLWLHTKFDDSFNNVRLDGALTAISSTCFFQVSCIVRMRLILPVATINLGKEAAEHDNERVTWKILNHQAQVFHPPVHLMQPAMMTMLNSTRATAMRMQKANLHFKSSARSSVKNTAGLLSLLGAVSAMTAVGLYYNSPVLSEAVNNQDNQRFKIPRLFHTSIDPHDHRPFEILSQKTINAIFRSGEVAYRFAEPIKGVSGVYVNSLRSNDPVEDHYSVDSIGSTRLIAGVYDGKVQSLLVTSCWICRL